MGKGNKTTTKTDQTQTSNNTASTTIDPIIQQQVYKNIEDANKTAAGYTPATIGGPAGFTADQLAAFEAARKIGGTGSESVAAGKDAAMRAAGYTPDQIKAATYDPAMFQGNANYTAQGFSGPTGYDATGYNAQGYQAATAASQGYDAAKAEGAQGYGTQQAQAASLNRGQVRDISGGSTLEQLPQYLRGFDQSYQQNVIDSALSDLNRARIMTTQGNDAAAARAGAFGSRRDILDAETNRGFADAAARTSAELRNQGFQTALGSLSQDQQRQLAAGAANQNADTSVYGANANFQQSANLSNAEAANQAAAFKAQAGNQFTLTNAQAENQARAMAAESANSAALANASMATGANRDNAASTNAARQFAASETNNARQFSTGLGAQVGTSNAAAQNAAGQFNAGQNVTVGLANQGAANAAGQFNANSTNQAAGANQAAGLTGNAQTLAAGQTLANIGGQQQGMAINGANALNQVGTQQQGYNQSVVDVNNANADRQAQAEIERLRIQKSGLEGAVYGTTQTGSGTNTSQGTQTVNQQQGWGTTLGGLIGTGLQIGGAIASGGASLAASGGAASGGAALWNKFKPSGNPQGSGIDPALITSDKRMKENIIRIGSPLMKVKRMTGVNYDWKGGGADSGLLAQDVAKASPRAVRTIGGIKAYNPAPVLGLLVESVKELDKRMAKR